MKTHISLFIIACIATLVFSGCSTQSNDVKMNIRFIERIEITTIASDTIFSKRNIKRSTLAPPMEIPILSISNENFPEITEKINTNTKISRTSNRDTSTTSYLISNSIQILSFEKFFGYTNEQIDIIDHRVEGVSEHIVTTIENTNDSTKYQITCKFNIEFRGNCNNEYTDEAIVYYLNNEILSKYNNLIINESGILK